MRSLIIVILLGTSLFCEGQKKAQPQFIKFDGKLAHPEKALMDHPPLYISMVKLTLPLPAYLERVLRKEKEFGKTDKEIAKDKQDFSDTWCRQVIADKKSFDVLHGYILKNSNYLFNKLHRPGCLIVIDNKNRYLPQRNMKKFYKGLKFELVSKKCDTSMLSEIRSQFTIRVK